MPITSTYTTILASQTDADSPLDETLMEGTRQNIDVLFKWMGGETYTPSTSHNHDGVNSRQVAGTNLRLIDSDTVSTASPSTAIILTGLTTVYHKYTVNLNDILVSATGLNLILQMSTDNGVTFPNTTAYAHTLRSNNAAGQTASNDNANATAIAISSPTTTFTLNVSASAHGYDGELTIYKSRINAIMRVKIEAQYQSENGSILCGTNGHGLFSGQAIGNPNAIKVSLSSSVATLSGRAHLYAHDVT